MWILLVRVNHRINKLAYNKSDTRRNKPWCDLMFNIWTIFNEFDQCAQCAGRGIRTHFWLVANNYALLLLWWPWKLMQFYPTIHSSKEKFTPETATKKFRKKILSNEKVSPITCNNYFWKRVICIFLSFVYLFKKLKKICRSLIYVLYKRQGFFFVLDV